MKPLLERSKRPLSSSISISDILLGNLWSLASFTKKLCDRMCAFAILTAVATCAMKDCLKTLTQDARSLRNGVLFVLAWVARLRG